MDYEKKYPENCIKFDNENIFLELKEQGEYSSVPIDSILIDNKGYHFFSDSFFVGKIDIEWNDRKKGIAEWSIKYNNYRGLGVEIKKSKRVQKKYVTPENFTKSQNNIVEKELKSVNIDKYSIIKELPILGSFHCEKGGPDGFNEGRLKLSKGNLPIYDEKGNFLEKQPYVVELTIDKHITSIGFKCSLKKIEGSNTKYAVFFNYLTMDTKNISKDIQYYSKTHPIAEIEILDNNTIKKRWIGLYNMRTKKVEDYGGQYSWDDKCNNIIVRTTQF